MFRNEKARLSGKGHLFGLDLLRLFAAAMVVFDHFGAFSEARPDVGAPFAFSTLNFANRFGWVGVEIFFVISGFVIALSARGASPGGFLKRRVLRIFPALWVCSFISLVALATLHPPAGELLLSFVHSITLSPRGPYVDGAVWSLIVEAAFYLLIWFVLLTNSFQQLDRIAAVLGIGSAVFLTIFCFAVTFPDTPLTSSVASLFDRFVFKILLLRYGVFFALGMILWLGFEYGFTRSRKILGGVMVIFGVVEIAIQAVSETTQAVFAYAMPPFEAVTIPIIVWLAGTMVLVASVSFRAKIGDMLKPRSALVTKLGLMTFPLYLIHYTLGRVMVYSLISAHVARPVVFAISFGAVWGLSWLIMMVPEPAIQAKLRGLMKLDASAPK